MPEPELLRIDLDTIQLAVLHWRPEQNPESNSPILLLHATGFHAHCWREVVRCLPNREVYAVDLPYHGRSGGTGRPNWLEMAEQISLLIDALELTNITGVGHSLGGYLIASAAAAKPALFRHLVLIDPVIFPPERYGDYKAIPSDFDPAEHFTAKRQNAWESAQAMFERFADRHPFNTWQPQVLRDYCDYGLAPAGPDGLHPLACDPVDEAGIYLSQAGNEIIHARISSIVAPVTLLRAPPGDGTRQDFTLSPTAPDLAGRFARCTEYYLEDLNHFIPMQRPDLVAQHILAVP